ncbi:MAG: hypothetical protein ACNA7J_00155 [Wenzhouxiangella sp.]
MSDDDKDPFETFSSHTLKRAEEMCSGLSSGLSLDRRGQSSFYQGAITDLDDTRRRTIPVTVVETEGRSWFTLIMGEALSSCKNALLVYRTPPSKDMKYVGRHEAAEPGKRGEDDRGRFVTRFEILRDASKG